MTFAQVAVKFLRKDLMEKDPYWKTNLYREVAILKKLCHPNIAQVSSLFLFFIRRARRFLAFSVRDTQI